MLRGNRWLREAGIFISTISLLFLPWLYDPYLSDGMGHIVMGTKFLTVRSPVIIGAFICLWLAYSISRITPYKWLAVLSIFVSILLYHYAYMAWVTPGRWDPWGIPLGRVVLYGDVNYDVLLGGWLNIVGILFLFIGLIQEVGTRNGKIFVLSGSGAILGWILFWGSIIVLNNASPLPIEIPEEIVMWVGMPGFPVLGGLIAFYLARKQTISDRLPSAV